MSRPFDYVDGKKIDLSLQEHRDTVIRRNKELQKSIKDGICIFNDPKLKATIIVRIAIECYVCGTDVEEDFTEDIEDFELHNRHFPTLTCNCCKAVYDYNFRNDSYNVIISKKTLK